MRRATLLFLAAFVLLTFVGVALAAEMSGQVTAVDTVKGTVTLKSGTITAAFDCETGSLIKDVKVGDQVTVVYKDEGGKKVATKVTTMREKKSSGGYQ